MFHTEQEFRDLLLRQPWRKPRLEVTRELLADSNRRVARYLYEAYYYEVHRNFDRESYVFVWAPLALPARLAYWWRYETSWRCCIERAMRGRIADVAEGDYLTNWRLRPLRRWTWRRTRRPSYV